MNSSIDTKFSKLLDKMGSPLSIWEVRAFLMGTIAATNHAPMQVVFEHIASGATHQYENISEAQHYMSSLMELWNQLAEHQKPNNPFRFSPFGMPATPDGIKKVLSSRVNEILQFIKGLDAGGTDPREFSADGQDSFKYLSESDSILHGVMKVLERDKNPSVASLEGMIDNLQKIDEIIHDCVHRIVMEAQDVRLQKINALQEKEDLKRQTTHVGRNDPCPCGSGSKFKKCCLLKLQ